MNPYKYFKPNKKKCILAIFVEAVTAKLVQKAGKESVAGWRKIYMLFAKCFSKPVLPTEWRTCSARVSKVCSNKSKFVQIKVINKKFLKFVQMMVKKTEGKFMIILKLAMPVCVTWLFHFVPYENRLFASYK